MKQVLIVAASCAALFSLSSCATGKAGYGKAPVTKSCCGIGDACCAKGHSQRY